MEDHREGSSGGRPKVVLFHGQIDNSLGVQSELDLDLYDTDEIPDSPHQQHPGISLSGIQSILTRESLAAPTPNYARAAAIKEDHPSDVASTLSSQHRTHRDNASSAAGSGSTRRLHSNRPVNPHPTIRTNFTTTGAVESGSTPYLEDNYEQLSTPPGDPPHVHPEELLHPAFAQPIRKELSMRAEWMIGLVIVGIGLGIAIESQNSNAQLAYWLTTIGELYVRMTACLTLPMAFCQVVTCTAELINNATLRRLWKHAAFYFILTAFLSSWLGIACATAFHSHFERHSPKDYRLAHPKFAFKCNDGHYIEQQPSGIVTCSGTTVNKNTTFPRLVDVNQQLGLEDSVGNVDISGYVFAMVEVFFPQNVAYSLARDNFLSSMIIAVVLGIAIGKSYTCPAGEIRRSQNPLFRLFTHMYLSLFAMNEWVQFLALWATVPVIVGAVLVMPDVTETLSLTRYYIASGLLAAFGQCLVVVPVIFYIVVRQNPYRWIVKMLAPISYGMVLQNAFLSLPMATKAALRSNEISPRIFGAVYPVLSALNRSHFALGCPTAILYVAAFSGCSVEMNASNVFLMFGLTFLGCFGDTMLPRTGMAYFLMIWRAFCANEDTPSSVIMIGTIGILIYRVSACIGTTTNLLLVRIIACAVERDNGLLQQHVRHPFGQRDSASHPSSAPIASPL